MSRGRWRKRSVNSNNRILQGGGEKKIEEKFQSPQGPCALPHLDLDVGFDIEAFWSRKAIPKLHRAIDEFLQKAMESGDSANRRMSLETWKSAKTAVVCVAAKALR